MFNKRYLFILVPAVLLIVIGAMFRNQKVTQIVEGCRNAWSSDRPGYTVYGDDVCSGRKVYGYLVYKGIDFSSPDTATVYFTDGTNHMTCDAQWRNSRWVVSRGWTTLAAPCP